jgi:hypothetical protein
MHTQNTEPAPHPSAGPTVLELGAGVGAAVIYTEPALEGGEIEIKSRPGCWDGSHTAIRRRSGGRPDDPPVFAAVFYGLAAGRYDLRVSGANSATRPQTIQVFGGHVTEHTLKAQGPSSAGL